MSDSIEQICNTTLTTVYKTLTNMHFAKKIGVSLIIFNALQVILFLSLAIHVVIIVEVVIVAVYVQRIRETVTKIIATLK